MTHNKIMITDDKNVAVDESTDKWIPVYKQQDSSSSFSMMTIESSLPDSFKRKVEHRQRKLRDWWHDILRRHESYPCYCICMVLPSNKEVICYLKEYPTELHILSGDNCLVITLDEKPHDLTVEQLKNKEVWEPLLEKHTDYGYTTIVAEIFEIQLDDYPCLLFFNDIRSPEHVVFSLENLSSNEIASELKSIFSEIGDAVSAEDDILKRIVDYGRKKAVLNSGKTAIRWGSNLANKTLETAVTSFAKSLLPT